MREYELTVLIHPDLEADLETALTKVRSVITTAGGEITSEDNWGKKKLAYRIARQDFAIYIFMELKLPADAPLRISNTFNITDEVLRYLLVATNDKIRAARESAVVAAASRAERGDDRGERGDRGDRNDRYDRNDRRDRDNDER